MEYKSLVDKNDMLLYAITDSRWLNGYSLEEYVENALKAGATFLQLREKEATCSQRVEMAKKLKPIAKKYNVKFVINDDVMAAKEADVDGVHIGQSDMDYENARKILGPDKIIGMTAKTVEQAKRAQALGADYIGTGAVFHTSTKTDAKDMPRELLYEITSSVEMPIVAIGGITHDNMDYLEGTQVSGIAVVSAVFGWDSPQRVYEETKKLYEKAKKIFFY